MVQAKYLIFRARGILNLFGNPAVVALSLRPVVLRPRFSEGLPFHQVDLSNIGIRF